MTPPTIDLSDLSSVATAAEAIGWAALPKANTQTRAERSIFSPSTARAVAASGAAAATADSYNSNKSPAVPVRPGADAGLALMRPRRFQRGLDVLPELGVGVT
jgi:hypothetical protein